MKFIKTMMVCSIFMIGLAITACKKQVYTSRDISGLLTPQQPRWSPPWSYLTRPT